MDTNFTNENLKSKKNNSCHVINITGHELRISIVGFLLVFLSLQSYSQTDTAAELKTVSDSILREGIELYECATASSVSSGFLIEKLSTEGIFGYITYKRESEKVRQGESEKTSGNQIPVTTIFLKENPKNPEVRYTFSYPAPFNPDNTKIDGEPRPASDYEMLLVKMQNTILKMARKRKSFFTNYAEIVLNPVFIQTGNYTLVYMISSSHDDSFIPLGNDYLLAFNEKGKLISKEKIHQNLIEISATGSDTLQTDEALSSFHTHSESTSPFITSTDICTILLNKDIVKWKSHVVISSTYVSFFFPEQKLLEIITREEYEKM